MNRSGHRHENRMFVGLLVFVGLLFVGSISWDAVTSSGRKGNADSSAAQYIREMHRGWTSPAIQCQSIDTDNNGYVSCTVGDGVNQTEAIECASYVLYSFNKGCRVMRAQIIQRP